jgi:hypothetical protein
MRIHPDYPAAGARVRARRPPRARSRQAAESGEERNGELKMYSSNTFKFVRLLAFNSKRRAGGTSGIAEDLF